jgi:long-chain acyl-CoA synthetase
MKAPPLEWLQDAASTRASHVALQFGDTRWSFAELADRTLRTTAVLKDQGIEPRDRVGLVLGAGPEYVTGLLGILALGAVAVPLNPLYRPAELAFHARENRLAGIITKPSCAGVCAEAMDAAGQPARVLTFGASASGTEIDSLIENATPADAAVVLPEDVAVVLHTAGSTGQSKLVARTNSQLRAECDSFAETAQTTNDDVIFGMLPLYHCHGLFNCLFAALRAQCRLYLFSDPRPIVLVRNESMAAIAREGVTVFPSVPFQLEQLMLAQGKFDLSAVRLCFTGGAALKEQTYQGFNERFGVAVRQQYGCTECGAVTLNLSKNLDASCMSVGKPLAGVKISIRDADDSGIGEIHVASPAMTDGYESRDELNSETFVDGVFRTGDMGMLDSAGNLHVTQRRPIYIDVAGYKVDSTEVEDVIRSIPNVVDVMVVGTQASPASMKAIIVCSRPIMPSTLREFCRQHLASYKIPSNFDFRETIPRDSLGKRLRKELT